MLADAAHRCSPAGIKEVGVQSWSRLLYFPAALREAQCPASSSELHCSVCCTFFKSTPICQLQNHISHFFPVLTVIFQPSPCQHVVALETQRSDAGVVPCACCLLPRSGAGPAPTPGCTPDVLQQGAAAEPHKNSLGCCLSRMKGFSYLTAEIL